MQNTFIVLSDICRRKGMITLNASVVRTVFYSLKKKVDSVDTSELGPGILKGGSTVTVRCVEPR